MMHLYKIAILGGTGHEGAGLGYRWACLGHQIIIGSRSAEKAIAKAEEINEKLPLIAEKISGTDNYSAVQQADIVVLSVPYSAQESTLTTIKDIVAGKPIISVVVPLKPPKVAHVWSPEGGSAAEEAQAIIGKATHVVAAFQNVSATHLMDLTHKIDCDVLVCGDDAPSKKIANALVEAAGMKSVDAGPLVNSRVVEGLTAVLIGINMKNKIRNAGIKITGLT